MDNQNKLLTAKDVAKILNVKEARIFELTRLNLIPTIRLGTRQYRYSERALNEWIENGGNQNKFDSNQNND